MASMVIPNHRQAGNGRISEPKTKPPKKAGRPGGKAAGPPPAGRPAGAARQNICQGAGRGF